MTRPIPLKNSMYGINRFLDNEYGDFGFVAEELKLFPGGKYLAVLIRLDDDSRFLHVFDITGGPAGGWERGVAVPCADEVVILPGETKLAVFTKCGTGEVKVYPVQSGDPESEAISVTFSRIPLYVTFTRGGRIVLFCDYRVDYHSTGEIDVVKIPTLPMGFAYIHAAVDTSDSLYLLYTLREGQKARLKVGKIPLPPFPYYSPGEFWEGVEVISKSAVPVGGGKPVGDIWLEDNDLIAALGSKGGKEIIVMTPHGTKRELLLGELVYLSFTLEGLFLILGIYGGELRVGLLPFESLRNHEGIKEKDFRWVGSVGRYVPGVLDPKFAGFSFDGRILYLGRTSGRTVGNTFYYFLRRDVDYVYQLEPAEGKPRTREAVGSPDGDSNPLEIAEDTPLMTVLRKFKQVILYGPPGTGKTYIALKTAENAEFVTFHQSYSYEDFVEGFRPAESGESVSYTLTDGVLKRLVMKAMYSALPGDLMREGADYGEMKRAVQGFLRERKSGRRMRLQPTERFYLIIDEINRGNISRIFGELVTLLDTDKRLGEPNEVIVTLPYSGELFALPPNLYIIGTMNSADRSIALLDLALRRRFAFVEVPPKPEILRGREVDGIDMEHLLTRINSIIEQEKGKDYAIGHAYLLDVVEDENPRKALYLVFYHRILPLLQEYFYGDWERLHSLYPGFEFIDERGRTMHMNLDEFMEALHRLVGSE